MSVRVGVISYGKLTGEIERLKPYIPGNASIVVQDGIFETALLNANNMEKNKLVDVIVSAGANGTYIRNSIGLPYVDISVTGFDLLQAIKKAQKFANKVGVVTFSKRIEYISQIKDTLNIDIFERTYENKEDLYEIIDEFKSIGIHDIIGSSLVCELVENKGMRSYFIYSKDGIMTSISHAIDIAETRNRELEKAMELEAILEFAYEGIIVTDNQGNIKIFNKAAEKITGIIRKDAIGYPAVNIIENTRLDKIMQNKSNELNQIQKIGNKKILTNRVSIIVKNKVIGALATFQTIDQIRKAEDSIRHNLYGRGFNAKNNFEDIIGKSDLIKNCIRVAKTYAKSDSTVLIQSETGTGKELFAQSIHNESKRFLKPFVAINCSAIAPSLLESELFGYEDGAFTGAKKGGKYGVFELANEGTVFLDEIGEIPLEVQTRMLRVLEEKEVFRVGGDRVIKLDIRVIAATNKDLLQMVKDNKFREDLYYRLNILKLKIPTLKERDIDIPILFETFIKQYNNKIKKEEIDYVTKTENFVNYKWPGNIRELRNLAEQIAVLYNSFNNIYKTLECIELFKNRKDINDCPDRMKIINALNITKGNKTEAAKILGLGRTTLWRKIKEYEIEDKLLLWNTFETHYEIYPHNWNRISCLKHVMNIMQIMKQAMFSFLLLDYLKFKLKFLKKLCIS